MKRLLLAAPLLLATACATNSAPYAPVGDPWYQAIGAQPFWQVVIGDDVIVFRPVAGGGERRWSRVLPRTVEGVRTWQSGAGQEGIIVTARPGPRAARRPPAAARGEPLECPFSPTSGSASRRRPTA